ncbi:hypothetical protein FH972_001103 [Carpinus fangiana]|uniref:DC-UbP/UBTD2 N-terminal domain-containing protein n=1 Tax=Carpinus fangiana TaxID=176857 RepID=A0A5N6QAP7_9ROSI|nr:hypothetical protein FH972_001103 [Carpinus fangiana]
MAFPRSNGKYSCPRLQRFAANVCACEREREAGEGVEEGRIWRNRIFVVSVKRLREEEMTWQSESGFSCLHEKKRNTNLSLKRSKIASLIPQLGVKDKQVYLVYLMELRWFYMISEAAKKIRKPKPWKHTEPITRTQLMRMRDEFWDTAPHYGGQKEIWDALQAAAEADLTLAQAIVDSAGVIVQSADLTICYDEREFPLQVQNMNYPKIWDALQAAAEADLTLAQAIVDSAGVIVQSADLTICYDERGASSFPR